MARRRDVRKSAGAARPACGHRGNTFVLVITTSVMTLSSWALITSFLLHAIYKGMTRYNIEVE